MPANPQLDTERLTSITALYSGSHNPNGKMCAMEAVAYVAREPWSDHPECACPVIGAFMRAWNDALPDAERTSLLLPIIPKLVGTRGSKALEARRAIMAADWYVRVQLQQSALALVERMIAAKDEPRARKVA